MLNKESIEIILAYQKLIYLTNRPPFTGYFENPDLDTIIFLRSEYFKAFYELNREIVDNIYYDLFVAKTGEPAHSKIQKAFMFKPDQSLNEDRLIQEILCLDTIFYIKNDPDNAEAKGQRDLLALGLSAALDWDIERMPKHYSEYPGKLYEGESLKHS